MCIGIGKAFPSFPIQFSLGLVLVSMVVSILTGFFRLRPGLVSVAARSGSGFTVRVDDLTAEDAEGTET